MPSKLQTSRTTASDRVKAAWALFDSKPKPTKNPRGAHRLAQDTWRADQVRSKLERRATDWTVRRALGAWRNANPTTGIWVQHNLQSRGIGMSAASENSE